MSRNSHKTKGITAFIILFSMLIILIAAITIIKQNENTPASQPTPTVTEALAEKKAEYTSTCLLVSVNVNTKALVCRDAASDATIYYSYNSYTEFYNRFKQIISPTQLNTGDIIDVTYDPSTLLLSSLSLSSDAWELTDVNGPTFDSEKQGLTIGSTNYRCSSEVFVTNGIEQVNINDINIVDVLRIRGVGNRIYSIEITTGHGILSLTGTDKFVGGNLYIDYVLAAEITNNLKLSIREGTYLVSVSNDELNGEKEIVVKGGSSITYDLTEYEPEPVQTGFVTFNLYPSGAILAVDGLTQTSLTNVELSYGQHSISVALGGYTTWNGTINVCSENMDFRVDLIGTDITNQHDSQGNTDSSGDNTDTDDGSTDDGDGTDTPDSTSDDTPDDFYNDSDDNTDGSSNTDGSDTSGDDSTTDETDTGSGDSGSSAAASTKDGYSMLTLKWLTGAIVYIDSVPSGVMDELGTMTTEVTLGTHSISLVLELITRTYTITVTSNPQTYEFPTALYYSIE